MGSHLLVGARETCCKLVKTVTYNFVTYILQYFI